MINTFAIHSQLSAYCPFIKYKFKKLDDNWTVTIFVFGRSAIQFEGNGGRHQDEVIQILESRAKAAFEIRKPKKPKEFVRELTALYRSGSLFKF